MNNSLSIDITKFLPHREPMLMVDAIIELCHEKVITQFEIKESNVLLDGTYFSEVGLVENAAQTCSSIVGQTFFVDDNLNIKEDVKLIGFISGIKKVKVTSLPIVNTSIKTFATLKSKFDAEGYSICTMECKTFDNTENLIFEAEINLFIQEVK